MRPATIVSPLQTISPTYVSFPLHERKTSSVNSLSSPGLTRRTLLGAALPALALGPLVARADTRVPIADMHSHFGLLHLNHATKRDVRRRPARRARGSDRLGIPLRPALDPRGRHGRGAGERATARRAASVLSRPPRPPEGVCRAQRPASGAQPRRCRCLSGGRVGRGARVRKVPTSSRAVSRTSAPSMRSDSATCS